MCETLIKYFWKWINKICIIEYQRNVNYLQFNNTLLCSLKYIWTAIECISKVFFLFSIEYTMHTAMLWCCANTSNHKSTINHRNLQLDYIDEVKPFNLHAHINLLNRAMCFPSTQCFGFMDCLSSLRVENISEFH